MSELKCQKCDDIYLLRDSLKGLFLAASQFPKNRETRAPLVGEVKSVLSKLPEKHQIFSNAPDKDPDGDDLVIRFNRKDQMNNLYFIIPELFISLSVMALLVLGVFKNNSSKIIFYFSDNI